MRHYIIATICLVITFAAVGCGQKKSGSKASMRARSGVFDGGRKAGVTTNGQNTGGVAAGENGTNNNKSKNSEPCISSIDEVAQVDGEKLDGELKSLKDPNSNDELVLESMQHFFEIKNKSTSAQIEIEANSFVDNNLSDAANIADKQTNVTCVNGAYTEIILPNRISLKDGSYKVWRRFFDKDAKAGSDNKINSFIEDAGTVEADEYQDKVAYKDKDAVHTFWKKDNHVYWHMKRTLSDGTDTRTFVLLAKYKQQPAPAATDAAAAPPTSASAKP